MNELLKIFEGKVELSEELKEQLTTLWEAMVAEQADKAEANAEKYISEEIVPFYEAKTQEYIDTVVMPEVNRYVSESVKNFAKKHEAELKNYAVTEANGFVLSKMKELFEGISIAVPESKKDELNEAVARANEMAQKVEQLMQDKMAAETALFEMKKEQVAGKLFEGLSDMQVERLRTLLEGVDASDLEVFERKAKILRESVESKKDEDDEDDKDGKDNKDKKDGKDKMNESMDPWLASLVAQTKVSKSS